jgi:hypothetical protein
MMAGPVRVTACCLGLMLLPAVGYLPAASAQTITAAEPAPPVAQAPTYAPEQLDQLLAPIALYPDPLLAQILMASTYPLEVVEATRWVQDRNNGQLRGDQLDAALQQQDWDPSVKSLVPFPQTLQMMNSRLDWTQALGNAFLAQQADVMASVQQLRAAAEAARTLQSTPQQTVSTEGQMIAIEPTNPRLLYVPYYNSQAVYGSWAYPDYPPVDFPPPPNYGYVAGPGIAFGVGLGIVDALWGWDQWDWGHRDIHIDADRFNNINSYVDTHDSRPRYTATTWQHDPTHRRGVPYSNPAVGQRFRPAAAASADARRNFRGFDSGGATPAPAAQPTNAERPGTAREATGRQGFPPAGQRTVEAAPRPQGSPTAGQPTVVAAPRPQGQPTVEAAPRPQGSPPAGQRTVEAAPRPQASASAGSTREPVAHVAPPPAPPQPHAVAAAGGARPLPTAQRPLAPVFSSLGKGPEVKAQSQRGQASRQTVAAAAPARAAPPAQRSAPPPAQPAHAAPAAGDKKGNGNDQKKT